MQGFRDLIAQGVIGLSVCIGGYFVLVAPVQKDLQLARAEAESAEHQLRNVDLVQDSIAAITAALDDARSEAYNIERAGRAARDQRELFASIMRIAAANDVQVDQLTPTGGSRHAGSLREQRDIAVGYRMNLSASYSALGRFIKALRQELGFASVRTMRIVPSNGNMVFATVETQHFFFDPAPAPPQVRPAGPQEGSR